MFGALSPGVQHLQKIHPLVVHFHIAFLAGAAFFQRMAYEYNAGGKTGRIRK